MRDLTRDEAIVLSEASAALTEVYTTSGDDCDQGCMLIDDAFKVASQPWAGRNLATRANLVHAAACLLQAALRR